MSFRIVCIAVLLFAMPLAAVAQSQWWLTSQEDTDREWGKLQEIKDKRRVFVNVVYTSTDPLVHAQQEREAIRRIVTLVLNSYKEFEIVSTAERAEFAINITASQADLPVSPGQPGNFAANLDPTMQTPLEVAVVVRGDERTPGNYCPRVVWELASPNVRGNPGPAAGFAIDGFIGQLKKLRGMKK